MPTRFLRPTPPSVIPRSMYPSSLRVVQRRDVSGGMMGPLRARHTKRGLGIQIGGKRRTFVLFGADRQAIGIFQRIGPKRHHTRPLWLYSRKVTIPPRLGFGETAQRVHAERFPVNLARFADEAIARIPN